MTIGDLPVVALTAPSLLGLAILMLFTGKLWTNAAYQQKVEEAKWLRQAYEAERKARSISDAQTAELLETQKTSYALLTAVFHNSEEIRRLGVFGAKEIEEP